jgi:hypothetical protein
MACTALTKGRGLLCSKTTGGIKNIYFAVYDEVLSTTISASEVTDIDMGTDSLYRYTTPMGTASLSESISGDRAAGTLFYTPTLNITLNKLSKEDQNEIKILASNRLICFAELNSTLANGHNVIVALGIENGMELNAGTMDSGDSFGSRNGYTLTLDGMEKVPFQMVVDYTTVPFDNADSAGAIPIVTS